MFYNSVMGECNVEGFELVLELLTALGANLSSSMEVRCALW